MVGDALVCFRAGTTDLLRGRRLLSQQYQIIFGIPNTRMSSCQRFQRFYWPLALTTGFLAYQMPSRAPYSAARAAASVGARLRSPETRIACAQAITVLTL